MVEDLQWFGYTFSFMELAVFFLVSVALLPYVLFSTYFVLIL